MWGTTWFGGQGTGGQKRKDAPKKAILDLRQQLDMLQKRERHLMNQMDKQDEVARENVTSNKTGTSSLYGSVNERSARSSLPLLHRLFLQREWRQQTTNQGTMN